MTRDHATAVNVLMDRSFVGFGDVLERVGYFNAPAISAQFPQYVLPDGCAALFGCTTRLIVLA